MYATAQAFWLTLLLLLPTALQAQEPLHLGTFSNTHSPVLHVCERVLREAYAKLGRSIVVEHLPAERALYWASSGRLDGDLCRGHASEGLLLVPTAVYYWQLGVFSTRPLSVQTWSDLQPYKIAYERGMRGVSAHQELDLVPVNSIQSGIQLLAKHRVDILLDDYNSVLYAARKMKVNDLLASQPKLARGPTYHLLNKKHAVLARQLNAVLAQMTSDGRIEQIEQEVMAEFMLEAEQEDTAPLAADNQ